MNARMLGEEIYRVEVPEADRPGIAHLSTPEAYSVRAFESGPADVIVYAKLCGAWKANPGPVETRWLLRHLVGLATRRPASRGSAERAVVRALALGCLAELRDEMDHREMVEAGL